MSRIGQSPIIIPAGVTATFSGSKVTVTGPKGELHHSLHPLITAALKADTLTVNRLSDTKLARSLHGLTRSLISNMVIGVTQGFTKKLELVGTGYRAVKTGDNLTLSLGLSHPVEITAPSGITFTTEGTNKIIITGINKQQVGNIAASIRALKKPEPYKGKGIRFEGEVVRRKAGKAAKVGSAA